MPSEAQQASIPRAAIYFPHTGVRTVEMLKAGLLLWDEVEYIAPDEWLIPDAPCDGGREDQAVVNQAMDLLLRRHVPSDQEKNRAHETIEVMVKSDLHKRLANEQGVPYLI